MGKFWRLLGKGLGWLVRNPEAIAGAKEMWGQLRKGPAPGSPLPHGTELCTAQLRDDTGGGVLCTLPLNHDGPHIAVGTNPLISWR
jgi:hypothetical protein